MQIELLRVNEPLDPELPFEYKPYRVMYWFMGKRVPVEGGIIYLPDPVQAKRIEDAANMGSI